MTRKKTTQTTAQKRQWLKFRILSYLELCSSEQNASLLSNIELIQLANAETIFKNVLKNWRNSI